MALIIKDKSDLADVLVAMSFAELMQVSHELVSMVAEADPKRDIDTPVGMAEMLSDWAQSHEEDE